MQMFRKKIVSFQRGEMLKIDVKNIFGQETVFLFPRNSRMRFSNNKINIDGIKFKTSRKIFEDLTHQCGIKDKFVRSST